MTAIEQSMALAQQHHQAGRWQQAEVLYRQVVQADPRHAEAWNMLGALAFQAQRLDLAPDLLRKAITVQPDNPTYHFNLAVAYQAMGRLLEAVASYTRVVQLKPDWTDAYFNLAKIYMTQQNWREAIVNYGRVLEQKPDLLEAHVNLGAVYFAALQPEQAVTSFRAALRLNPNLLEAYHNLGAALFQLGRLAEAEEAYDRAIALQPDLPSGHFGRALNWLLKGDWAKAWTEYEWRWRLPNNPAPQLPEPLWDGSPLTGKTILIYGEQGLGDMLQFLRFLALLKEQGARIILQVPNALIKLLTGFRLADVVMRGGDPLPPFDVHCPILSLPRLLGTTLANLPNQVPYLWPDPKLVATWRERLARLPGFKIGITWQGDPKLVEDKQRSIPLQCFEPIARIPGVQLISLQKGPGSEQVAQLADRVPVTVLPLDEEAGPFMDTAAVMVNLDLVIGADTALVHLAGALGARCWLALSLFPYDWRWQLDREDSPWYPTVRVFRQTALDDWTGLFARLASALRQQLGLPEPAPEVTIPVPPGELIDKITILAIKRERITDAVKLANVRAELAALVEARRALRDSSSLAELTAELKQVNESLWDIEDAIRACERQQDFGPTFIELARSVYRTNDRRAALKRRINELLGARLLEEKAYQDYQTPG